MMTSASHSAIPPPGPPTRPGVLKLRPHIHTAVVSNGHHAVPDSSTSNAFVNIPPVSSRNSNFIMATPSNGASATQAGSYKPTLASGMHATGNREVNRGTGNGLCDESNPADLTSSALEGLPIPPPSRFKRFTSFIWGASKKDKKKSNDKNRNGKERQSNSVTSKEKEASRTYPTAPQLPEEIHGNQKPSSMPMMNAWGSPVHEHSHNSPNRSETGLWNRNDPSRKCFRLTGHVRDLSTEKNVLPLWLEEDRHGVRESDFTKMSKKTDLETNDVSFDSRWNSLSNKSTDHLSSPTVRPPGWEDVDQAGKRIRNRKKSKVNFCPSFTIKDLPSDNTQQQATNMNIRPLSPPVTINISPPLTTKPSTSIQEDAFTMANLSSAVDDVISHSYPAHTQIQSGSVSNVAPQSLSTTPSRTPQSSPSVIDDRHLWASSDSFICEDFSFGRRIPSKRDQQKPNPSESLTSSISQVLLQHPGSEDQQCPDYNEMHDNEDLHKELQFYHNFDLESDSCNSPHQHYEYMKNHESNVSASFVTDAKNLSITTRENSYDDVGPEGVIYLESHHPTIRMTDDPSCQHWIKFDNGKLDNFDKISMDASSRSISSSLPRDGDSFDLIHQSNFKPYYRRSLEHVNSPTSPTSPVLPRHCSGSTLNLVEPRLQQTPETFTGELVRTYSMRGRRAGKRVTRTVSQKMKPNEYGKLTEPVAPMLSKAALTMTSGPGLFEQASCSANEMMHQGANDHLKDTQIEEVPKLSNTNLRNSSLSPAQPTRSGSLRVPRLSTIFVRRSVSLNAPKVGAGEVPFKRLPEKRGSFRKAILGISAIARNMRHRSGGNLQTASASRHIIEKNSRSGPIPQLQRSGSTGSVTKQVPKAPRLPRRAISHRHSNSNDI